MPSAKLWLIGSFSFIKELKFLQNLRFMIRTSLSNGSQIPMMTSSNGNISRVTGPLCGKFTVNKRLSKQSRRWRFATPSRPLWRHCNEGFIWHISETDFDGNIPLKPFIIEHGGWGKMADNIFSRTISFYSWLKFKWNMFLMEIKFATFQAMAVVIFVRSLMKYSPTV